MYGNIPSADMIKQQSRFQKTRQRVLTKIHGKIKVLADLTKLFLVGRKFLVRV
jgi:hypothetical protein